MASKRVQEIVNKFMTELVQAVEEEAAESIQDRLRGVIGATAKALPIKIAAPKRRRTTKGYVMLRPCPVPDCKEMAAPRYQMVCKGHSELLTREAIIIHRDNANKPGGVWHDLKPGRKVS
jgi:hypothetical protein